MAGRITAEQFEKACFERGMTRGDCIAFIREDTGVPVRLDMITKYTAVNGQLSAFMSAAIQLWFNQWDEKHEQAIELERQSA